uniref:C2 domain-containing protein n=1 Tax=Tetradesmus obliquus TaxID=3088 RepID=A0A383VQB5_TETOB|eukprot:jgi/Sobl393_1/11524/SZX66942.1
MSTSDPTLGSQADRAREAARHVDRSAVLSSELSGSLKSLEGLKELLGIPPAGNCSAASVATAAAQQLQHKRMEQAGNDTAANRQRDQGVSIQQQSTSNVPTAKPAAAATPSPAAAAAAAAAPGPLLPAATNRGPLITTSPEESAQAQQALDLLNSYDFKIYGQGMMAGATAVPLTPPEHKVLFQPTPETTTPSDPGSLKPLAQQEASNDAAAAAAAVWPAGNAGGSSAEGTGKQPHYQQQQQRVLLPGKPAAEGPACRTLQQVVQQQEQQVQMPQLRHRKAAAPTAAAAAAAGGTGTIKTLPVSKPEMAAIMSQLDKQPHRQQHHQQSYKVTTTSSSSSSRLAPSVSTRSDKRAAAAAAGSSSRGRGIRGWMRRKWQAGSNKVVQGLEHAAAWILSMLWLGLCWLGRLLLTPLTAAFRPWYQYNRDLKANSHGLLAQQLDLPALQEALGALPSWLAGIGGATEQVAWINTLLAQVWPIFDPVVCQLIRSTIEPLLDDMKPPFIAAMGFQKLTLGELPVQLEGLRVIGGDRQGASANEGAHGGTASDRATAAGEGADKADRLELEVDFHWVGEPNISFFVELALAGPYTRLVPKVSNLSARGTLRLGLTRLVPQLPGFGALLVSLAREPQIKFSLDFGPALGGRFTAKPVAAFLDPFLRDTLATLVVWPNRFVIPLLPREVTGNLDDLGLHSVGVLEVEVLSAKHLPKKGGAFSTVDPQVELWTQPQHHVTSSVKKSTRNPKWKNQKLEVLVQEPASQQLRVVLQDIDMLNFKELMQVNLLKGASQLMRSANPIGRTALPLRDICGKPYERQEVQLRLSSSEWAYELGVVDEGDTASLNLALTYRPFTELKADSNTPISCRGVLIVDVRQAVDLPPGDWDSGDSDPYVLLKVAGQKQQTVVLPHTRSPTYNAHFEFFNVTVPDTLQVQVWDRDYLKPDDLLGFCDLPVKDILTWSQGGGRGWRDGWWRLQPKGSKGWGRRGRQQQQQQGAGRIEMKVQFRPYSS